MTAGDLRAALEDFGDHLPVVVEWGDGAFSSNELAIGGGRDRDGMAAVVITVHPQ